MKCLDEKLLIEVVSKQIKENCKDCEYKYESEIPTEEMDECWNSKYYYPEYCLLFPDIENDADEIKNNERLDICKQIFGEL